MRRSKQTAKIIQTQTPSVFSVGGPLSGTRVCVLRHGKLTLVDDLGAGFDTLGCQTRVFEVGLTPRPAGKGVYAEQSINGHSPFGAYLFREIDRFDPHLILCANGYGYGEYQVAPLIAEIKEIPLVNWFVDDPEVLPPSYRMADARYTVNAVFDRWYAERQKSLGFAQTFYLPLATAPERFQAENAQSWTPPAPVVFVGSAGLEILERSFSNLLRFVDADPAATRTAVFTQVEAGAHWVEGHPGESASDYLDQLAAGTPGNEFFVHPWFKNTIAGMIEFMASFWMRKRILSSVTAAACAVVGSDWQDHLHGPILRPSVPYQQIAEVYRSAPVNLNISRYQLKTAVNQRVFDVPAAGGFLLTDYRPCLDEMFDVGREIACYRDRDEMNAKIRHYLDHPEEREAIIQAGRERVLRDHTFARRASQTMDALKSFGVAKGACGPGQLTKRLLPESHWARAAILAEDMRRSGYRPAAERIMSLVTGWGGEGFDYSKLAAQLVSSGLSREALSILDVALSVRPNAGVLVSAGMLAYQIGQPDRAVAYANRALEMKPGDPEALALLEQCKTQK